MRRRRGHRVLAARSGVFGGGSVALGSAETPTHVDERALALEEGVGEHEALLGHVGRHLRVLQALLGHHFVGLHALGLEQTHLEVVAEAVALALRLGVRVDLVGLVGHLKVIDLNETRYIETNGTAAFESKREVKQAET